MIKETAINLSNKYKESYDKFCDENPGYIMNGDIIKSETLIKASVVNSINELKNMIDDFKLKLESMKGKPNGFRFSILALEELINELK